MRILQLILILCLAIGNANAQLSEQSKMYLLTCDVGDEVWSQFGHSALRVVDPSAGIDMSFNWGMFEFSDDEMDFNYKFAKGRLPYYMDASPTQQFLYEYQYFKREVRQQELNLTLEQKNKVWSLLKENALPENKYYRYDFFFDNCATRIRDILEKAMGPDLVWGVHPETGEHTFREMIDVGFQSHPWLDFGIDLVLGYRIDQKVDNKDLMFNPFYMEQIFDLSQVKTSNGEENLVISEDVIVPGIDRSAESDMTLTPIVLSVSILVISLVFAFFNLQVMLRIWTTLWLFVFGVLGIVLLFMWVGTDHYATKGNLNLLWANPLWLLLIVVVWVRKWQSKMASTYLYLSLGMLALVLFFLMLPQEFHPASRIFIVNWAVVFYFFYRNQILKEKKD